MKKTKIEKTEKRKTMWKTIAGVSAIINIGALALLMLIVRNGNEKNDK